MNEEISNNLKTITYDNINNIIEFSQNLNISFSGINIILFQMISFF